MLLNDPLTTRFLKEFEKKPPNPSEHGTIVRNVVDQYLHDICAHKHWKNASIEDKSDIADYVEKFVMSKLYKFCFSPSEDFIEEDKKIQRRFATLQNLTPTHFEIPTYLNDEVQFGRAIEGTYQSSVPI